MSSNEAPADSNIPRPSSGSSPYKRTVQSSLSYESSPPPSFSENQQRMSKEMQGLWVGPMPVQDFMDEFIPRSKDTPPSPKHSTLFADLEDQKHEKEMYAPFINIVDKHNITPGFKIVDTSEYADTYSRDGKKIRPDPTMYRNEVDTEIKVTQFNKMELHFEFKTKSSSGDPFHDPPSSLEDRTTWEFESQTVIGAKRRGQLTTYATEWCSRQHRTFAFSVLIIGSEARFIRWDRSAAIVTEKFNYKETSQPLIDFLWYFCHLDNIERGRDDSVRDATPAEIALAKAHLDEPPLTRPVVVHTIEHEGQQREFIAWGSMADAESLTGRATRAYPVYDKTAEDVRFLKDSWRGVNLERESDILRELNAAGVRNVPKLICGGDVDGSAHITRSYEFAANTTDDTAGVRRMPWKCGMHNIVQRIHHKFVEDFVGIHLESFTSTKGLMKAVHDAFIGHQDALELCGILHRDVSARNVMMHKNGRGGILNDWDLAKRVVKAPQVESSRGHERTGTWQFISAFNLMYPGKQHILQDDLESFVYVVLYHVLRYCNHSSLENLADTMIKIFDDYTVNAAGVYTGGLAKGTLFSNHQYVLGRRFNFFDNPHLNSWFKYCIRAVGEWHRHAMAVMEDLVETTDALPLGDISQLLLKDHATLGQKWDELLQLPGWPENDKAVDQLPDVPAPGAVSVLKGSLRDDNDGSTTPKKKIKSSRHQSIQQSQLGKHSFTPRN